MSTALVILNKLKAIDVQAAAVASINATSAYAVGQQRLQLFQGLKADDTYQPDYSPVSVAKFGKTPGPIKLYDTGAYYAGLKFEAAGLTVRSYSTDEKNDYLEGLYHPLGLGTDARTRYKVVLLPEFVKQIKRFLQ